MCVCVFVLQGMDEDSFEKTLNTMELDFLRSQQRFCQEVLKLSAGQRAAVSNSRVSGARGSVGLPLLTNQQDSPYQAPARFQLMCPFVIRECLDTMHGCKNGKIATKKTKT